MELIGDFDVVLALDGSFVLEGNAGLAPPVDLGLTPAFLFAPTNVAPVAGPPSDFDRAGAFLLGAPGDALVEGRVGALGRSQVAISVLFAFGFFTVGVFFIFINLLVFSPPSPPPAPSVAVFFVTFVFSFRWEAAAGSFWISDVTVDKVIFCKCKLRRETT